jgi:hypothetical protein
MDQTTEQHMPIKNQIKRKGELQQEAKQVSESD